MGHDIIFLKSTCDIWDHPLTAQLIFCGAERHFMFSFAFPAAKAKEEKTKKTNYKQETSQLRNREKDVRQNITASLGNCRTESEMIYL